MSKGLALHYTTDSTRPAKKMDSMFILKIAERSRLRTLGLLMQLCLLEHSSIFVLLKNIKLVFRKKFTVIFLRQSPTSCLSEEGSFCKRWSLEKTCWGMMN